MTFKHWLIGATAALALCALSASVQAAPFAAGPDRVTAGAGGNTALQNVVWVRRCWWHDGYRHCRRVWSDSSYYYEPYYDGGYYYGPSFGFRDGHGRRHGGHRR
jgi:hypothetical protein